MVRAPPGVCSARVGPFLARLDSMTDVDNETLENLQAFLTRQQEKEAEEEEEERVEVEESAVTYASDRKWAKRKKIAAWVLGVALPGGGGAYWRYGPEPAAVVEPKDVKDAVDKRVGALEEAINGCQAEMDAEGSPVECSPEEQKASVRGTSDMANKKADRLGDLHFDQRSLILDVRGEIVDKLDARTGQEKRDVKVPPSVEVAKDQVKAWKQRKEQERMQESLNKGDPFADL